MKKEVLGLATFGSGWVWLVRCANSDLDLVNTFNAGTSMTDGYHANYVDTRNDRGGYLKNFWNLVDWDKAASLMK